MSVTISTSKRLLIIYYLLTLHIVAIFLVFDKVFDRYALMPRSELEETETSQRTGASPDPAPSAPPVSDQPQTTPNQPTSVPVPSASGLIIPVAGVSFDALIDSFQDERSDGRSHDAIDIAAPAGTPVVAVADGTIVKLFDSEAGGITIYQMSADQRFVYYYAHLQSRAEDIKDGDLIRQGRTIGYVGDTGNAGEGNYHLHFSVLAVTDPRRYWEGVYINPLPLFQN